MLHTLIAISLRRRKVGSGIEANYGNGVNIGENRLHDIQVRWLRRADFPGIRPASLGVKKNIKISQSSKIQHIIELFYALNLEGQVEAMANSSNLFPSFLDSTSPSNSLGGAPRLAPSPMSQQQQQANGNGNAMNGMPMIAGQQMDVNFLYQKVVELSEVLRENRDKTQGIVNGAEDLAVSLTSCIRHGFVLSSHGNGALLVSLTALLDSCCCQWSKSYR